MGAKVSMRASAFLACCLTLFSQAEVPPQTRAEQIERQRDIVSRTPVPPDTDLIERSVLWAYDHNVIQFFTSGWKGIAPTAGGMIDYSGIPIGMQFLRSDLLNGNMLLRGSARLSTRGYQLYDLEAGMPRLANDKLFVDVYLRHRNYSQVDYYGPGPRSSKNGRTNYRLEDSQADFTAGVHPIRWLRFGVIGGYYRPNIGSGTSSFVTSMEKLYSPAMAPGLNRETDFLRGGGVAHVDFRDNPYGPRSGGQYYMRFDYNRDRFGRGFTFRRLTAEAQQLIPMFNQKRVIALRAKTQMSFENPGQRVPFYMQPSLGGSDDLRGFRPFRFYDNNSIVYNAEWRWEVTSGADAALFFDAGKVFPRPGLLNFRGLQTSFGGGLRVRAPVTGAVIFRLDAAASREGVQVSFSFGDLLATPQIRTGRELSPPVGRLP